MATDYLSKAKDVVGEKYSSIVTQTPSLSTIVGNNLQPSKMPGVGSSNYGRNQNPNQGYPSGNQQRTNSDTRWDDWDEPENQRPQNPVGSSGNWNRDSGYQESSNSGYERDISGNSSVSNSGSREIRNPYRPNYGDDNMSTSLPVQNRRNMPTSSVSSTQAYPNGKGYSSDRNYDRERSPSPDINPPTQKNNYYDPYDNNSFSNQSKSSGFPNTNQNLNPPSSTLSRSHNIPARSNNPDKSVPQNRNQVNSDGWDEWDNSFTGNTQGKDTRAPIPTKNTSKPVSSGWDDNDDDFTTF
jgi:hypothetical protein